MAIEYSIFNRSVTGCEELHTLTIPNKLPGQCAFPNFRVTCTAREHSVRCATHSVTHPPSEVLSVL